MNGTQVIAIRLLAEVIHSTDFYLASIYVLGEAGWLPEGSSTEEKKRRKLPPEDPSVQKEIRETYQGEKKKKKKEDEGE